MADESANTQTQEATAAQTQAAQTGDDGKGKTPTPYELELRKENEKLRKKLEARLQEEETAKKKALEEQGKYKELYDSTIAEITPLKERLKSFEERENAHREELLAKLPEDKREKYAAVTVAVLEDVVALLEKPAPTRPDKPGSGDGDKSWEEMDGEAQNALKSSNPDKYRRLYKDYYKRKNGIDPPFIP